MSELFKSRVENIEKDLNRIPNYDFIIFWGGEDISTGFYKERSVYSNSNEFRSKRDFLEETAFNYAKTTGTPMLGICRGAQLLCALSGGRLWQHVENHGRSHLIKLKETNELLQVTSTHHQMMRPTADMKVLGVSATPLSPEKFNEAGMHFTEEDEAEIVFIPKTASLCIQGHPEYTEVNSPFSKLAKQLVIEKLLLPF